MRVVDQHGSLLTGAGVNAEQDRLERQAAHEEKLRAQIAALLRPMLGEGNFSSEVQVELDFEERTAATESWDKDGVVRSETSREATMAGERIAGGVPGVLANTPPPPARLGEEGEAPAESDRWRERAFERRDHPRSAPTSWVAKWRSPRRTARRSAG